MLNKPSVVDDTVNSFHKILDYSLVLQDITNEQHLLCLEIAFCLAIL